VTRAALYARLSRDRTGEETATSRQLDDCRAFAAARGWEIVGEYTDADVSAYKRNTPRPGYDRMLQALEAGEIDAIVGWKLDRLLRRVMDWETLWERCEPRGVHVVTVRDGIDTSLPMVGELLPRLMATFAQLESKNLSVREIRKHEDTAKRGGRAGGGHRPFGLTRDWTNIVPEEDERVRDAVTRILAGESAYSIAREWNAAGLTTPTGKPWSVQLLVHMLRSPRVAGLREHRGAIVARGSWPALIDERDHERLRAILDTRRRPGAPARFLLSGLVRCGRCGRTMRGRRRTGSRVRMYGCEKTTAGGCGGTYVMAEPLETLVSEAVLLRLDTLPPVEDQREDLDALRADEEALETLARDHYVDRTISRTEYLAARDALHERVEDRRRKIALPKAHDPNRARDAWVDATTDWRRTLIATIVTSVSVGPATKGATRFEPERVSIVWR